MPSMCSVSPRTAVRSASSTRRTENVIYGRARPRIGIVRSHHDLAGATVRDQMPQRLGGEDQASRNRAAANITGTFLQRLLRNGRERQTSMIRPGAVGQQVAARGGRTILSPGKTV